MYVTDTPVMDRITNPAGRELSSAMALFEDMTADLHGAAEDVTTVAYGALECDDIECTIPHAKNLERVVDALSGRTDAVLAAQEAIREALVLLDIAID